MDEKFKECIIDFSKEKLPQIYKLLNKYNNKVDTIIFKSRDEADKYIKNISE